MEQNLASKQEEEHLDETLLMSTQDSRVLPAKKKKKKKKKKGNESTAEEDKINTPETANEAVRPGKKKLRKLRYQQKQLTPTQFLWNSAEACKFTGSIVTIPYTAPNRDSPLLADASTVVHSKIEVLTFCAIATAKVTRHFAEASPCCVPRIHVQPLLVLDLNGILCHRIRHHRAPNVPRTAYRQAIADIACTPIIPRTDLTEFLTFLDQHFCLAVWTSAKNKTAKALVKALIPPDIANRLLFVWAQHHCDSIQRDKGNAAADDDDADAIIYEKNLTKVWQEYPLWNVHTTILMDDSPDKCQKWHENAIHPPALNGRLSSSSSSSLSDTSSLPPQQQQQQQQEVLEMSDEENERLQLEFFEGLVQQFNESLVVAEWTAREAPTEGSNNRDETLKDNKTESFKLMSPPVLLSHLREKAVSHMGWV